MNYHSSGSDAKKIMQGLHFKMTTKDERTAPDNNRMLLQEEWQILGSEKPVCCLFVENSAENPRRVIKYELFDA